MLFLFKSSWPPIVELFLSSETPGSGCFPGEGAGRKGGEREQASTVLSRVPPPPAARGPEGRGADKPSFPLSSSHLDNTSPLSGSHHHQPCPTHLCVRSSMESSPAGPWGREAGGRVRGEEGAGPWAASHHTRPQCGPHVALESLPPASSMGSSGEDPWGWTFPQFLGCFHKPAL